MRRIALLLCILSMVLAACQGSYTQRQTTYSYFRAQHNVQPEDQEKCLYFNFDTYENIDIQGDYEVEIVARSAENKAIKITGDNAFLPYVQGRVVDKTLSIRTKPGYFFAKDKPVKIEIPVDYVRSIHFNGKGNLVAKDFNSKTLSLSLDGDSSAWFQGNINLTRLNFNSSGKVVMYWINSNRLLINARGTGSVMLGGIANKLQVNASDRVGIDTRFVRTPEAYVHTRNKSKVIVSVQKNIYPYAQDQSAIFYYAQCVNPSQAISQGSGAVVRMDGAVPPLPHELW